MTSDVLAVFPELPFFPMDAIPLEVLRDPARRRDVMRVAAVTGGITLPGELMRGPDVNEAGMMLDQVNQFRESPAGLIYRYSPWHNDANNPNRWPAGQAPGTDSIHYREELINVFEGLQMFHEWGGDVPVPAILIDYEEKYLRTKHINEPGGVEWNVSLLAMHKGIHAICKQTLYPNARVHVYGLGRSGAYLLEGSPGDGMSPHLYIPNDLDQALADIASWARKDAYAGCSVWVSMGAARTESGFEFGVQYDPRNDFEIAKAATLAGFTLIPHPHWLDPRMNGLWDHIEAFVRGMFAEGAGSW